MNRQKSFETQQPALYIVATPIGNLQELTPRARAVLKEVDVIAAEDTRNTQKLLAHFGISTHMIAHHKFNEAQSSKGILHLLEEGKSVAIVSDAGYPLISDPGAQLVSEVIDAGYPAVPILFYGFLDSGEKQRIRQLLSLKEYPMTLIFYEAPHRIAKMLQNCLDVLGDREMCLARELTKKHEEFLRGRISEVLDMCDSLKGEMVVVMAGYQEEKEPDLTQAMPLIKEHIRRCINEGMTTNEAIRKVAREHGLSKNEVYRQYHGLN